MNDQNPGLHGAFGEKGTKLNDINYLHPNSEEIMAGIREVLQGSSTGMHLLKVTDLGGIPVNFVKGSDEPTYIPETKHIYVHVPGRMKTPKARQVLDLINALRSAEQEMLGMTAPDKNTDFLGYASMMHAKNLDCIVHMCKVVNELTNSSYFPVLLDEIEKLGHLNIYKTYVNEADALALSEAYTEQ